MDDAPYERLPDSPWQKLRRRKVVQWGVAYAAGAWGLLQGLAYVSSTFHWPRAVQPIATVLLLLGLPLVLVFAWFHGDRGQQRISFTEASILTVLFLLGGFLFWNYLPVAVQEDAAPPAPAAAAAAAPAPDTGPSIAVLPFVNMSGDKDNDYFSDGISEELLNVLARIHGLGVASRTSSFAYKGRELPVAAIAKELGVNHVLEGSVRKAGNRVRITAQLIDAVHDRHLWSETYDRELSDIFAVQDEIANAIVGALRGTLGNDAARREVTVRADTANLQAYDAYLKARELFIARSDLRSSVHLFERAVELDPKFARGWEGLAAVASVMESWNIVDRDYNGLARDAARRALELDASLSMPWAVLGSVETTHWPADWAKSMEYFDRALAADPRNASAFLWRGIGWLNLGFFAKALADFDRCLALEPGYHNARRYRAVNLLYMGRTDDALADLAAGVKVGFVQSRAEVFVAPLVQRGDVLSAGLLLEARSVRPEVRSTILAALAQPDRPIPDAERLEHEYLDDDPARRAVGPQAYLWLKDYARAAATDDANATAMIAWDRFAPGWYGSSYFKQKLERLGAVAYWREHGFPPQCHAVGAHDFACT